MRALRNENSRSIFYLLFFAAVKKVKVSVARAATKDKYNYPNITSKI